MKLPSCIVCMFLVNLCLGQAAQSDETTTTNYILFPIKTELQRLLLHSTRADAYAQFDVAEAVHEGKFDSQRFDKERFGKDLVALRRQVGIAKPSLQIYFRYAGIVLDPKERDAMESAVTALCRQAGFAKIRTGMSGEGGAWQEKVAKFESLSDCLEATESPIEDELVRVYPVRTKLSRFSLGDIDYDCVIELRQPIDGRFKELSSTVRRAIVQAMTQLELPQKRKLIFRCMSTMAGRSSVERYFGMRPGKPPLVDSFVKELGFQTNTYSVNQMHVSPEDLLGKIAPDFTLDALVGGRIHLHETIRGRVGLITFWGVACGPCRIEAPHLTRLHNEYGENGLAVVAVNGYDESRQVVENYARAQGLTHPIALMGRKVAEEQYTVASYPVTFLVDRTGTIIDYYLGFEPGDEKLLITAVTQLLDARQKADNQK